MDFKSLINDSVSTVRDFGSTLELAAKSKYLRLGNKYLADER